MIFGEGILYSIVSYLYVSCSGSINSFGEERANLSAIVYSVNEKIPVSKFRYFGKYIIHLDGYFYVHVSGQQQTG